MRKLFIVLTLIATSAAAQSKRPASFDDVLGIKAIQGATISPDGRWVIYGVREWVPEQDPSTPLAEAQASLRTGKMESPTHI